MSAAVKKTFHILWYEKGFILYTYRTSINCTDQNSFFFSVCGVANTQCKGLRNLALVSMSGTFTNNKLEKLSYDKCWRNSRSHVYQEDRSTQIWQGLLSVQLWMLLRFWFSQFNLLFVHIVPKTVSLDSVSFQQAVDTDLALFSILEKLGDFDPQQWFQVYGWRSSFSLFLKFRWRHSSKAKCSNCDEHKIAKKEEEDQFHVCCTLPAPKVLLSRETCRLTTDSLVCTLG